MSKYLNPKVDLTFKKVNPDTAEALEIVQRSAFTEAELAAYEKSKLDEITERSALAQSKEEGKLEEKLAIAKSLKSANVDINIIIASTGLSAEEISAL